MPRQTIKFNKTSMIVLVLLMIAELGFVIFFYAHQQKTVSDLRKQYTAKQSDLDQDRKMGDQLPIVAGKLQKDQDQLAHLENALSTKDYVPTLLVQLQKLAADTHNQITSVKPIPAPPPPPPPVNTPAGGTTANGAAPDSKAAADPKAAATPAEPAYDKYQVELSIQGTYQNVMTFLLKLTTFPKIVGVEKFQVTSQPSKAGEPGLVTANLTFTAYILKEAKS